MKTLLIIYVAIGLLLGCIFASKVIKEVRRLRTSKWYDYAWSVPLAVILAVIFWPIMLIRNI